MKPKISFYLDKRRRKKSGLYPVKLRVWDPFSGDAKFYPTGFDLSEKEFQLTVDSKNPKGEFREVKDELDEIRLRAVNLSEESNGRVFYELDKKLYRAKGDGQDAFYHFDQVIQRLEDQERIGTASSYKLAKKSLSEFLKSSGKSAKKLLFVHIDPEWLERYERYMVQSNKSRTTVGVYLRTLRAVFNTAIDLGDIEKELYPFGRRKYVIPAGKRTKKALSREQLKVLLESTPGNEYQEKAKDFFFFSYVCNGMNMKDIAHLKFSDMNEDHFVFYRAKTIRTTKDRMIPIVVYLNEFSQQVIQKYGNDVDDGPYVFPILSDTDDVSKKHKKVQAFTRSVNQHLKKLAVANNLPSEISSVWARHSFATGIIRLGKSMEFAQESFGHSELKTTLNYFAGFENEVKKEFAQQLMDF